MNLCLRKILIILLFLFAAEVSARTFYVSVSGNDLNNGLSESLPWKTLQKVSTSVFLPGDTIKLKGGDIFNSEFSIASAKLWINNSGTSGNPIVYTSYGNGKPEIIADSVGIYIVNKSYVKVQNIGIKGNFNPFDQNNTLYFNNTGIYILNTGMNINREIRVDSCRITNFLSSAIQVSSTHSPAFYDIEISNCRIDSIGDTGIFFVTGIKYSFSNYPIQNIKIKNCEISRVTGIDTRIFTGDGILVISVDGGIIERNLVYDCGGGGIKTNGPGPSAIEATECKNIVLQYNETYGTKTNTGSDGHGCHFDEGVQNSVMQYNYSHGNDGPGFSCHTYVADYPLSDSNNVIRYNISSRNLRKSDFQNGEITVSSFQSIIYDIHVYNNTIYVERSPFSSGDCAAILIARNARNIYFRNNSIISADSSIFQWYHFPVENSSNIVLQGNNYWSLDNNLKFKEGNSVYYSYNSWQTATGKELLGNMNTGHTGNPFLIDPDFHSNINDPYALDTISAFKFQSGSELKDNGLDLKNLFGIDPGQNDFYGNFLCTGIDCKFDIGAYDEVNSVKIKVKLFLEGLYDQSGISMSQDTVQVRVCLNYPPYEEVASEKRLIGSDGFGNYSLNFPENIPASGYFFLNVTHRNSIETWSSEPVFLNTANLYEYDFTIDSASAYGNNLRNIGGIYCIYSGDVNQDGTVDITDNGIIDNGVYNFLEGFIVTDLNNDQITDINDISIAENNSYIFISVIKP